MPIRVKHAIGLTFHRSCFILSRNVRLFIVWSLFCIRSRIPISLGTTKTRQCFWFKTHFCKCFNLEKYIVFSHWANLPWLSVGTKISPCEAMSLLLFTLNFKWKMLLEKISINFSWKSNYFDTFFCCSCSEQKGHQSLFGGSI